jgi:hypothetical protein
VLAEHRTGAPPRLRAGRVELVLDEVLAPHPAANSSRNLRSSAPIVIHLSAQRYGR